MRGQGRRVVYGITVGVSADKLLRGQLGWLRGRGWEVTLAVTPDAGAHAAAEREQVFLDPLPMSREISLSEDLRAFRKWVRLLRRVRPDAINVSTPKAALLGAVAGRLLGVPRRVYVMRGLRLEGATGVLKVVLWAAERLTVLAATDVVVVSRSLGHEACRAGLLRGRRTWLVGEGSSNGVLAAAVAAQADRGREEDLRGRLGFGPNDMVVGYVGRIARDKGVDTLRAAVELLGDPSVRVLYIGSTEVDDIMPVEAPHVHVEWTDRVWEYYSAMDVLCLPSRREGFPNVVLEAASAGVPTVTTRATGAVDSVLDGRTGLLVDVDDAAGLSRALAALAESLEARRTMGERARARVETTFLPEHVWSGIESVLQGDPAAHVVRLPSDPWRADVVRADQAEASVTVRAPARFA